MTGSQQKLYIDRDSARQFLFYKTDSKIPDIKGNIKYDTKFSASQTGLSDKFSSRVLKIAQKLLFALYADDTTEKIATVSNRVDRSPNCRKGTCTASPKIYP